ncbi:oligoribonuclease [Marchantia polymorpha subsp. ruderalis]|uniref:Exonuclease domain-containing protein n=2 Tax=Marchantia polymorpha TaxID=3197 RepID=A0AAF6B3B9_MARPO|nr:hypothetical protein MARPO_0089s0044 [Marchantia polymorpha]BBN06503.1 hypothetical protein Mp_3g21720 [Marchantia polymorpha subsp. ruderalis]|eukprot:PTQ33416.1 hypothetical protein MARPO_0089s0044 [Marchantia polymorpha]
MERLDNPFKALSLLEEDEDLSSALNQRRKKSVKTTVDKLFQDSRSKRNGNDAPHLYKPLVWIDLEMTGLDLERDRILEIACIITDGKLETIIEGPDLIIHQTEKALVEMNEWCQEHHTASGLVEGVRKSTITEQKAEEQVLDFVNQHVSPGKAYIAGNSVYVDLQFIRKYMPKLAGIFSHIVVDVSSVRALCVRWYPQDAERAPEKKKNHRALDDIKESIAELKYMKAAIFKKPQKC